MVIAALATFAALLVAWIRAPSTERPAPRAPGPGIEIASELVAEGA
jgi:hypothetical protein